MDFEAFKKSDFYYYGSRPINKTIIKTFAEYNIIPNDEGVSILPRIKIQYDLFHHNSPLKLTTLEMPLEFSSSIIDQYLEVTSKINLVPLIPMEGYLGIQSPGSMIPKHDHGNAKQILTYGYRLSDSLIDSTTYSGIRMGPDNHERVISYRNSDKFMFTILENEIHSSYSNEWRVFWIYNFHKNFELTNDLISGFDFIDVNKGN